MCGVIVTYLIGYIIRDRSLRVNLEQLLQQLLLANLLVLQHVLEESLELGHVVAWGLAGAFLKEVVQVITLGLGSLGRHLTDTLVVLLHTEGKDVAADGAQRRVCGLVVLRDLVVFVEGHHLVQDGLCHCVEWCELVRRDSDVNIVQTSDDWLELGVVHAVERLDHLEVVVLLLVFQDSRFDRRKMLLITQVDMVEQGALSGQESASQLQ